jgi:midasin (ATPase involved in ribosome maturation)
MRQSGINPDKISQAVLLDEINLAPPSLLDVLETWILEVGKAGKYTLSNGEVIFHGPIVVVATMNNAALSKAHSSLSTKLQGASHYFKLVPFTTTEMEELSFKVLTDVGLKKEEIETVLKAHESAAQAAAIESGVAAEKDSVSFREILRLAALKRECPPLSLGQLIEITYAAQLPPTACARLLGSIHMTSFVKDCSPNIRDGNLYLTDVIKIPLHKQSTTFTQLSLTTAQLRVVCLASAGLMANRSIALFGESGCGKSHIVQIMAQAVGVKLKMVQFNADTGMYYFNF